MLPNDGLEDRTTIRALVARLGLREIEPTNTCRPHDDCGNRNRRPGVYVRGALRGCENSIWATHRRQVTRKRTPDLRFRVPQSSFGRHVTSCRQTPDVSGSLRNAGFRARITPPAVQTAHRSRRRRFRRWSSRWSRRHHRGRRAGHHPPTLGWRRWRPVGEEDAKDGASNR